MMNQLDVYEILLILQEHMLIPDFVLVGKDVDSMISRAIGMTEMASQINGLNPSDETLLYRELNRMAMRTREYTMLHEDLNRGSI